MTNQILKKGQGTNGINSVIAAAVTGVIIGAGAAVAGAVALNDQKNRDKISTAVTNANDHAQEKMNEAEKNVKKVLA